MQRRFVALICVLQRTSGTKKWHAFTRPPIGTNQHSIHSRGGSAVLIVNKMCELVTTGCEKGIEKGRMAHAESMHRACTMAATSRTHIAHTPGVRRAYTQCRTGRCCPGHKRYRSMKRACTPRRKYATLDHSLAALYNVHLLREFLDPRELPGQPLPALGCATSCWCKKPLGCVNYASPTLMHLCADFHKMVWADLPCMLLAWPNCATGCQ
jgi:hypothetical protein|mmetsp:Transcript_39315/g.65277  ORF Transcript_39315/g.65277 Transcript_39315/m.65277 type:complete len:211 (+) Transcript_39315:452-1084(+)